MYRLGIQPVHIELFNRGEDLRFTFIEHIIEFTLAQGIEHQAMLIAQRLFPLLI